jgi:hypothetical protein
MKSIQEIEEELREVAKSNNLTGDSVELIIKLLAYNQYESNVSTRISLLEALPSRAVNINSKIQHAVDEMYSIYRGKNSKLNVTIKVTGNLNLEQYEEVYSDTNNTLYYSHVTTSDGEVIYGDYTFTYGQTYILNLIKAEEVISEEVSVDSSNVYLLESLSDNISEDLTLTPNINTSISLSTTKSFGEHIDNSLLSTNTDPLYMDLTTANYGVRFYSPLSTGFNSSINYILTYIPYFQEDVIEDFLNKMVIDGAEIDYDLFSVERYTEIESEENFLYNLNKNTLVQSRIRTNSDILDEFKSLFSHKILDSSLGEYDTQNDILKINYIPKNSNSPVGTSSVYEITDIEKEDYISKALYYVTKNVEVTPLYDHTSSQILNIQLSMIVTQRVDTDLISSYLSGIEYSLGKTFSPNQFLGHVNNIEGVVYSDLIVTDVNNNLITSDVSLNIDKYFLLLSNFTYSYKV